MQSKRNVFSVLTWLIVLIVMGSFEICAQQTVNTGSSKQNLPNFYGHLFGGAGLSFMSSDDITSLLVDDFGIGIGLPSWSYGIRCGFRHIAQIEYNFGKSHHDFNNNSIIKSIPSTVIKMDYDTKEMQFKINPFFWKTSVTSKGFTKVFFLVGGFGDVEWRDKDDDGFEGTSSIYGIEYALLSKHKSLSFSFKRYGIEFDKTTLLGIPFDHKTNASDYIFEIKFGFGTGI